MRRLTMQLFTPTIFLRSDLIKCRMDFLGPRSLDLSFLSLSESAAIRGGGRSLYSGTI